MSAISSRGPDGPDKLKDLSEPQCIIYDEEKEFSHAVKIWNLLSEASALLRHTELEVAYNTTTGKWGIIKRGLTGYREDASPSEAGAVIAEVEHQRGVNALTARPEQVGREASLVYTLGYLRLLSSTHQAAASLSSEPNRQRIRTKLWAMRKRRERRQTISR